MRLYHGSNTAFREVDLSLCRPNKDFGQGFYLALLFRQFALGLVTVEMLVREMQFKQLTIQYSFHTPVAVSALKFVGVDDVY